MAAMIGEDPEFFFYRRRATRSTNEFSRQSGVAFSLAVYEEVKAGRFKVPVTWGNRPVEFTVKPVQNLTSKLPLQNSIARNLEITSQSPDSTIPTESS